MVVRKGMDFLFEYGGDQDVVRIFCLFEGWDGVWDKVGLVEKSKVKGVFISFFLMLFLFDFFIVFRGDGLGILEVIKQRRFEYVLILDSCYNIKFCVGALYFSFCCGSFQFIRQNVMLKSSQFVLV